MTQNISLMSEDELVKLQEYLEMTKDSLGTKKEKAIALVTGIGGLVAIGTGVTVAILFPNPITFAVLGGIAFLTNKSLRPKKAIRSIRDKKQQRKSVKSDLNTVKSRLHEIKVEERVRRSLYPSVAPK